MNEHFRHTDSSSTTLLRRDLDGLEDRELVQTIRSQDAQEADRARAVLTERYQPLVIGQSAKLHRGRGPDHEDVVSVAQHGLQKAIADYDLDHGAPFAAYARAKVRGEMMRWFRDDRYSVHVPRPLHERFMQVRRAAAQLEADLHREPEVEEIAEHLDCPVSEVLEAMAVRSAQRSRINQLTSRIGDAEMLDVPDPDLAAALEALEERDQLLLYRRFWDGASQREVGEELDVSQAHVSRLEKRALEQLRELIGPRPAGV
ncbi:MAG: sigma-70 family RNA polymerase sigma factor [Xanthomonadales bacterium]|nr:sigma-70 family RNA polymerase sigma factor [Xanthomonadales bacterium]